MNRGWWLRKRRNIIENPSGGKAGAGGGDGQKSGQRKPPEKTSSIGQEYFPPLIALKPERLPLAARFHTHVADVLTEKRRLPCHQQLIARCHDLTKCEKLHVSGLATVVRSLVERKIVEFIKIQRSEGRAGPPRQDVGPLAPAPLIDGRGRARSPPEIWWVAPELRPPLGASKVRVNVEYRGFLDGPNLSLYLLRPSTGGPASARLRDGLADSGRLHPRGPRTSFWQASIKSKQKMADKRTGSVRRRIEDVENVNTQTKPEFIDSTFNAFAEKHPWVVRKIIRPNRSLANVRVLPFLRITFAITSCSAPRASC